MERRRTVSALRPPAEHGGRTPAASLKNHVSPPCSVQGHSAGQKSCESGLPPSGHGAGQSLEPRPQLPVDHVGSGAEPASFPIHRAMVALRTGKPLNTTAWGWCAVSS